MDLQKVDMYLMTNQKYFAAENIPAIRSRLESLEDSRFNLITAVELKDPTTLLIVSIFLGSLGIDRFMLGDIGMGILKLLTMGVCGILTLIDWFTIQTQTKTLNYNNFMKILG